MKIILSFCLIALSSLTFSQINSIYVKPIETDLNYTSGQDSHLVVRNTVTHLNKLFLFIGGTGSSTQNYQTISNFAGNLGFDVINLSYPNNVAAASLAGSSDSLVFDKYRQEVCYGTPLSNDVSVDTLNSIYTRTVKLLNYLNTNYPTQNWNQYLLNPTTLNWSKIAVGGHSQGGGHACYFAKFNNVERSLMFSSPNDYSNYFSNSAKWIRTAGLTPLNRQFAYLSLLDEVVAFNKQLVNLQGLGLFPLYDTTYVDPSNAPYNNSHCLYTKQSPGISILYHNTTTKFSTINNSVWTYMLTSAIVSKIDEVQIKSFQIFPNPTLSNITLTFNMNFKEKKYRLIDGSGKVIGEDKITNSDKITVDLSSFPSGIYFVTIDNETIKVIKG